MSAQHGQCQHKNKTCTEQNGVYHRINQYGNLHACPGFPCHRQTFRFHISIGGVKSLGTSDCEYARHKCIEPGPWPMVPRSASGATTNSVCMVSCMRIDQVRFVPIADVTSPASSPAANSGRSLFRRASGARISTISISTSRPSGALRFLSCVGNQHSAKRGTNAANYMRGVVASDRRNRPGFVTKRCRKQSSGLRVALGDGTS